MFDKLSIVFLTHYTGNIDQYDVTKFRSLNQKYHCFLNLFIKYAKPNFLLKINTIKQIPSEKFSVAYVSFGDLHSKFVSINTIQLSLSDSMGTAKISQANRMNLSRSLKTLSFLCVLIIALNEKGDVGNLYVCIPKTFSGFNVQYVYTRTKRGQIRHFRDS